MKKIISAAFAVICAVAMLLPLCAAPVMALEADSALGSGKKYEELAKINYTKEQYSSPEAKLATMTLVVENTKYALYVQEYTAETCVVDKTTGQMLFSNPYDVSDSKANATIKYQLLSQILLTYTDSEGLSYSLDSYSAGVGNDQVVLRLIKGGLRVEYTIGDSTKRKIVPYQIEKSRFEENILAPFYEATTTSELSFEEYLAMKRSGDSAQVATAERAEAFDFQRFLSFYTLMDVSDPSLTAREQTVMMENYPATKNMAIYVLPEDITNRQLTDLETYIAQNTEYSLEDMLLDHEQVGFELEGTSPAVFKMALEYTLTEDGLQVRLPSRGISFDTATYRLESVSILPYFGAARTGDRAEDSRFDTGYNFIPDGSGSIINFDQNAAFTRISGTLYGNDFGFYNTTSAATSNYHTWRIPVYGTVTETAYNINDPVLDENGEAMKNEDGTPVTAHRESTARQGYVAIITEGDSLTRIDSVTGGAQHEYNSVYTTFFPRQTDSYPLDGITVSGGVAMYTKAIERRYVGNYTIQYRMLWDEEANYVGMAKAYREFLIKSGALSKLEVNEDIPLYVDLIGDIDTTKKVLGVPVATKTAITSFEDAETIISELKAAGINNQSVRYLGWMNGGMASTAPTKLKVDKVLGGRKGLEKLMQFAKDEGVNLYMDFDFAYVDRLDTFDGYDSSKQAAKTIDGKTAYYKTYNAVTQSFNSFVAEVVSAHSYIDFYSKITEKYSAYYGDTEKNISVGSLGFALNSSQDEEFPLNREDAKNYTVSALEKIRQDYDSVLTTQGNAYTWANVDTILNIPLDSSNRNNISEEVPFIGIVLHGYMNYAGDAINLAGDYEYNLLKTIENGANPYFILAYENTAELKTNGYGQYYAVDWATWKDSVIEEYNKINDAIAPLQGCQITAHEFLGNRVVRVTYDNDTQIYLNYNNFAVTVDELELPAMSFEVIAD